MKCQKCKKKPNNLSKQKNGKIWQKEKIKICEFGKSKKELKNLKIKNLTKKGNIPQREIK